MVEPVTAMHVTPMGSFRSDAHVGTWSDNPTVLILAIGVYLEYPMRLPGVPDAFTWSTRCLERNPVLVSIKLQHCKLLL
ncbi:hypothetical protein Tco_1364213 [Tanacetum coccineum]